MYRAYTCLWFHRATTREVWGLNNGRSWIYCKGSAVCSRCGPQYTSFHARTQAATSNEVFRGRQIASIRIHVERVIGRIKNYAILKTKLPISMAQIANQIVCVCAWLVNFQPVLIPPPPVAEDNDVEEYLETYYYATDSEYDADSESSDDDNAVAH